MFRKIQYFSNPAWRFMAVARKTSRPEPSKLEKIETSLVTKFLKWIILEHVISEEGKFIEYVEIYFFKTLYLL